MEGKLWKTYFYEGYHQSIVLRYSKELIKTINQFVIEFSLFSYNNTINSSKTFYGIKVMDYCLDKKLQLITIFSNCKTHSFKAEFKDHFTRNGLFFYLQGGSKINCKIIKILLLFS